jgi:uncharacterized membrane protein
MNGKKSLGEFLKATLVGGLLFLVPLALVLLALKHIFAFVKKVLAPVLAVLPQHSVGGVALATIVAVALILLMCLLVGLFARTRYGRGLTAWFEDSLLGGLPQYRMVKGLADSLTHVEGAEGLRPVLVSMEGGWQLAYLMEPLDNGWLVVFIPQAPTPMSGNVMYLPPERVRPLEMGMAVAMQLVRKLGLGSSKALEKLDLEVPVEA